VSVNHFCVVSATGNLRCLSLFKQPVNFLFCLLFSGIKTIDPSVVFVSQGLNFSVCNVKRVALGFVLYLTIETPASITRREEDAFVILHKLMLTALVAVFLSAPMTLPVVSGTLFVAAIAKLNMSNNFNHSSHDFLRGDN